MAQTNQISIINSAVLLELFLSQVLEEIEVHPRLISFAFLEKELDS